MIDTEALRKKVIDLAIQGKLTERLPSDGNAEELYDQILNQKAQLIKEGKIKKEKAMPEIKADEIPFEIPENWKWVRLRDICKKIVDGDHNPPAGIKEKTEYLMLSAQNINNDKLVNIDNARYLTEEVFNEENKRTQLEVGDVLLTIVATLGRSCVYRETYNICFQRSVCVISTLINPDYLKRVLDSGFVQKLMVDGATGAAQPGFYLNKVEKICIPVPPMEMQTRIVDRIGEVLEQIDIIDDLQGKYSNDVAVLKSKIIDAGIQGKLTEQLPEDGTAEELYEKIQEEKAKLIKEGKIKKEKPLPDIAEEEIPFEVPDNWKWCRLGEIYSVMMGQSPDGMNVGIDIEGIEFHQGKIYFGEKYLMKSELKTSELTRIAEENSVLLCVRAPVGVVNITERKICIGRGLCALTVLADMEPYYLFYYLLSCRKSFENSGTGSTFSSITVDVVKKHLIPIPPLAEQKRIVSKIDAILEQLNF